MAETAKPLDGVRKSSGGTWNVHVKGNRVGSYKSEDKARGEYDRWVSRLGGKVEGEAKGRKEGEKVGERNAKSSGKTVIKENSSSQRVTTSMGGYIGVLIVGLIWVLARNYFGLDGPVNWFFTVFVAVFFVSVIKGTTSKPLMYASAIVFVVTVLLEVGIALGWLTSIGVEYQSLLVTWYYVNWAFLGFFMFFIGLFQNMSVGRDLSSGTLFSLALIILFGIFLSLPYLAETNILFENQTPLQHYTDIQEKLRDAKEHVTEAGFLSRDSITCSYRKFIGRAENTQECLKELTFERQCEDQFTEELEIKECVKGKKIASTEVLAQKDTSIEAASIKLYRGSTFADLVTPSTASFPLRLDIENPGTEAQRKENPLNIQVSCNFVLRDRAEPFEVSGEIERVSSFEITAKKQEVSFTCIPGSDLIPGTYELRYGATLSNVKLFSDLTRYFVGDKVDEEKQLVRTKIERLIKRSVQSDSRASGNGVAWLDFGIGNPTDDPLVTNHFQPEVDINVRNNDRGRVTKVHWYSIDAPGFYDTPCLTGSADIPKNQRISQLIKLKGCTVGEYPEELQNVQDYEPYTFEGVVELDYVIDRVERIQVMEGNT